MPRSTNNPATRRKKNRLFKRAKGFFSGRRRLLRTALETVQRAERFATRDRKQRKRQFRELWIIRLNAACREHALSYSRLIDGLAKANIQLNRKSLSELAIRDAEAFKKVMDLVKAAPTSRKA